MSDEKEKISAYLDDGLSSEELEVIESIESESEFGIASRYQMMGEALRGQLSDAAMVDVGAQVREALRDEAVYGNSGATESSIRKTPRQPMFDFSTWFRPLVRPMGGLAVAASVALVMVVAVTQVESPTDHGGLVASTDNTTVNIPDTDTRAVAVATDEKQPINRQAVNLDAYLAEHAEFAAQDTLQGRMPYVRAVSYESE